MNEDAALTRQLATSASTTQRTEFKLMPGSTADLSTEAGRELMDELTRGADGGSAAVEGRGFFDSSDRLYLQEQKRLEAQEFENKRKQDQAELQKFRSTALKVQAQKAAALVAAASDVQLEPKKKPVSDNAVAVRIKTKKRAAPTSRDTDPKPPKLHKAKETKSSAVITKATGPLLLGYSSSESDSDDDKADKDAGEVPKM